LSHARARMRIVREKEFVANAFGTIAKKARFPLATFHSKPKKPTTGESKISSKIGKNIRVNKKLEKKLKKF